MSLFILLVAILIIGFAIWFMSSGGGQDSGSANPSLPKKASAAPARLDGKVPAVTTGRQGTAVARRSRDEAGVARPPEPSLVSGRDGIGRVDARGAFPIESLPLRTREIRGLSPAIWRDLQQAFEGRCRYCGSAPSRIQRDHRVPVTRFGTSDAANVVPSCATCNNLKSSATEDEYIALRRRFGLDDTLPAAARKFMETLASTAPRESRQETLMREVTSRVRLALPARPHSAVLLDAPALDSYWSDLPDWVNADSVRLAGVSFHADSISAIVGTSASTWNGWALLLPEPSNPHDREAVAVVAKGRKVGYLPRGTLLRARAHARKAWSDGLVPVVRANVWNDLSTRNSVRIFLHDRPRVIVDF